MWVLIATAMIFFMQAGFAMLETGFTRAKNAGNIVMKNIIDFCISAPVFWLIGFGLMYGKGLFFGGIDLFSKGNYDGYLGTGIPFWAFLIFQTCFCGTSATIVSGAMAGRTKFSAYCLCSLAISLVVYPVCGHWIWGHGWLYQLGYHDFAGGTVVHVVGGTAALAGALILGPRVGKFTKDKKARAIPGHNLTMAALGMFILWFGWFGFNGGSALGIDSEVLGAKAALIFLNTNLSAVFSVLATMIFTWLWYKKPDVSLTINGGVAGLVAITAGCDVVNPGAAAIIGILAGIFVVLANAFVEKVLHVDDPVGAVGVHGGAGFLGSVMVGLFSRENGLFYGGGIHPFLVQLLGAVCVMVVTGLVMGILYQIINKTVGLRVPVAEEISGLDKIEHGLENAYEGFMSSNYMPGAANDKPFDNSQIIKAQMKTSEDPSVTDSKITKIEIITKQNKFDELKQELNKIGITGITVSQVMGCGVQKGVEDTYRGSSIGIQVLPKIRVEIVVAKVPVKEVVDTAKRVLYTGHIGDGKIFIYHVDNVIKVRTGEEGYEAMQNDD